MKAGQNLSTVRGVIIPIDWDESGNAISVAISSHDENEYHVNEDEKGKQLFALMQEEVEVNGVVREREDRKVITISSYEVIGEQP